MNISSEKNPRTKNLLKPQKKPSLRRGQNIIIVEDSRKIEKTLQGYTPKELFLCKEIFQERTISERFPMITKISRNTFKNSLPQKQRRCSRAFSST